MTRAPPGTPKGDGAPYDAAESIRSKTRVKLPARFYTSVSAAAAREPGLAGFQVLLDGKPVRTPKASPLILPSRALAEAIACEWQAQGNEIDPASMPLTRLANTALDGVQPRRDAVIATIAAFGASDLVCYRAEGPSALVEKQAAAWDPAIAYAVEVLGLPLAVGSGIMPIAQPPDVAFCVATTIQSFDAFGLAAVHVMTTLTGSVVLALMHANGQLTLPAAWASAHIDEDWQISRWGEDAEARARRMSRFAEMTAASRLLELWRAP